jgi:molybdopterin-containing oxidoreductase family membrane subunit
MSLTGYLIINSVAVIYILYNKYNKKEYKMSVLWPIIVISIPWAISIHTVTAFLYNGLSSRPFWNASILAPRFIASALCSGPAIMLIVFQIARKVSEIEVDNAAIFKISELMAFVIGFNLFLFGAEMFKEFYSGSIHAAPLKFMYVGLHGHTEFVPWMWSAFLFNITAFIIFLRPKWRENFKILNFGCVVLIIGVFIEKGMGLIIPGFIPDTLGEIYIYRPSIIELGVSAGIVALGALFYTLLVKVALPIYNGKLVRGNAGSI